MSTDFDKLEPNKLEADSQTDIFIVEILGCKLGKDRRKQTVCRCRHGDHANVEEESEGGLYEIGIREYSKNVEACAELKQWIRNKCLIAYEIVFSMGDGDVWVTNFDSEHNLYPGSKIEVFSNAKTEELAVARFVIALKKAGALDHAVSH